MGKVPNAARVGVVFVLLAACSSSEGRRAPRDAPDGGCEGGDCGAVRPDARTPPDPGRPRDGAPPVTAESGPPPAPDGASVSEAGPPRPDAAVPDAVADVAAPDAADVADATVAPCTFDTDCDDGAFCNGEERCIEGLCVAGIPADPDDGVACTVDLCDESTDAFEHRPDDTRCADLDGPPRCAAAANGRLVRDRGVCDGAGCEVQVEIVDDCLDDARYPTTFSCSAGGPAAIVRHEGTCPRGGSACAYADTQETDCASAIPATHPHCSGTAAAGTLTHHFAAVATCSGGSDPSCGYTESTSACLPGNPSCSAGNLTTHGATCTAAGGCGRRANAPTACPDAANTCTTDAAGAVVYTTFTPACRSTTACGAPTPSATTCPVPASTCTSGRLTTRPATCTVARGCGAGAASTTTCPTGAPRCVPSARVPTRRTFSPACNTAGTACSTPGAPADTPCPSSPTTCTRGVTTTFAPTCTGAGVCGETPTSTSCPDLPNTCVPTAGGPAIFTTYTPACNRTGTGCSAAPASSSRFCDGRRCNGSVPEWEQCNAAGSDCVWVAQPPCPNGCDAATGFCNVIIF